MAHGIRRPAGDSPLLPAGPGQMVQVPVEVAIFHQDLQELVQAARDLVEVAKAINNALVAVAGPRKEEPDGIGGTA